MPDINPRFIKKAEAALNNADWKKAVSFLTDIAQGEKNDYLAALSVFDKLCLRENKGICYRLYVLGNLPADILAHFCFAGGVSWRTALTAKAAAADPAGLKSFYLSYQQHFEQEDINKALRGAVIAKTAQDTDPDHFLYISKTFRYQTGNRASNVEFLLGSGASPRDANCDLLLAAVNQNNLSLVIHLLQDPQSLQTFGTLLLQKAQEQQHDVIYYLLKQKLQAAERYIRESDHILIENKNVDFQGGQVKTIFNFKAQRITEVYENNAKKTSAITSYPFEEYNGEALKFAHTKLILMGGKPDPLPARHKSKGFRIEKP